MNTLQVVDQQLRGSEVTIETRSNALGLKELFSGHDPVVELVFMFIIFIMTLMPHEASLLCTVSMATGRSHGQTRKAGLCGSETCFRNESLMLGS
jgi:hypothetical protein